MSKHADPALSSPMYTDLYLRLSIDREGKDSLERQEQDLREWAARERLTVRRVWRDAGISGYDRKAKRPEFESALQALRDREVTTLAAWKLDRLSRRGAGQIGLVLDDVEAIGGRLVFLKDGIDTSHGGNQRMLIVMLSEQARAESANTSTRVRSSKDRARRAGLWLGGPAPFGYEVTPERKLRPMTSEAPLAREAVDRLLAGETMLAICRSWNERQVPTRRRGSKWRPSTISAIVRSPALAGLMPEPRHDGDSWSTNVSPWRDPESGETVSLMADSEPIVSEAERARLLDILDGRLRRYGRGLRPVRQPKSLLGGLLRCSSCGHAATTFGDSYRCRRSFVDGADCESPLTVSISTIEPAVKRAWANGLAAMEPDSGTLAAIADHWIQRYDPAPLRERAELSDRLAESRARMAAADEDRYVRGTLDADRHERIATGIKSQIADLTARIAALPRPEADLSPLLDPLLSLPAIEAAGVNEARELLRLAISRIEVTAAPRPGARFQPHERMRIVWHGDE